MIVDLRNVRPTPEFIRELVSDGAMFRAKFIKRTTGEVRDMTAKLGVKAYVKGEGLKFAPSPKGLLGVFEMTSKVDGAKNYKFINMEGLLSIKVDGTTILFQDA